MITAGAHVRRSIARCAVLAVAVTASLTALPATWVQAADATPVTSFSFVSASPDEFIGQGRTVSVKASSAVVFRRQGVPPNGLRIDLLFNGEPFPRYTVALVPGAGDQFRRGVFSNAERAYNTTGYAPGVEVTAGNRRCSTVYGSFEIRQLEFAASGEISVLEAYFTQRCERSTAPLLRGVLKLNALPLSYSYTSEVGSHVGKGTAKSYTGSQAIISAFQNGNQISIGVDGLRDRWSMSFIGVNGGRLVPGSYTTNRMATATTAGLDVDGNSAGCNQSTGTLKVHSVWYKPDGIVGGLYASFTQRCDSDPGQLTGTVHYLA